MVRSKSPAGGVYIMRGRCTGSAVLWFVSSIAWGSMSGYAPDNHSKSGCLPTTQSGGRVVNLQSSLFMEVKRVRGEKMRVWGDVRFHWMSVCNLA